jgi:nucleoside-diphosphate-sugar epimerase
MNILVAGGAGFIGSHLCEALLQAHHTVACVDNLVTGDAQNVAHLLEDPQFTFLQHDITEKFDMPCDAIFHLASPASPISYWNLPFETITANTQGTWNLLEIAQRHQARFLLASTSEVYGDPLVHPQDETYYGNVCTIGDRACYDESKRLGETITMEFWRRRQVDARIVRIFNTYGPRNQLDDGRMIPNFITSVLRGQPLTIYGTGQQTRSLCYISDLVDGLCRALFTPATTGNVFNLGNPEELSVVAWAQKIIALSGARVPLTFAPKREDDPERRRPNIDKAQRMLDWRPQIDSTTGLTQTIAWFQHVLEQRAAYAVVPSSTFVLDGHATGE